MILSIVLVSCLFCFCFLKVLIPRLHISLLDLPNVRSSHLRPTPRGGGVSFVLVALFASSFAFFSGQGYPSTSLSIVVAPLAFVGFLDDRLSLPASWRYGVQLLTAGALLFLSPLAKHVFFGAASGNLIHLSAFCLLLLTVTAVINFSNFMDGLDGLLAGCMAVTISALTLDLRLYWSHWALVGALIGFLIWNWSPAKVFMGDVGSTFLGSVFAGLLLQASSWQDSLCYLLVATPLLADAAICVIRRLCSCQRVFEAHRLHLFQRLNQAGWPHSRVSLLYIFSTAVLALAMLTGGFVWVSTLSFAEVLIGIWLDQRVAVPFAVASKV